MKIAFTVAAIVGLAATGSAFAQNTSAGAATQLQTAATYQQSPAPLTRAQVYADMVHAQKDGQIARLNKLYYGKP